MTIAFITSDERGRTDRVLAEVAERLTAEGVRLAGAVQRNAPAPDARRHDMELEVLPTGGRLRISQDLGPQARGCRLDPGALEQAVAEVGIALKGAGQEPRLGPGQEPGQGPGERPVDLVILNKFGKHEAEGRGFRDLLAQAAMADLPVLIGVGTGARDAFAAFTQGLAEPLPADPGAVLAWCRARLPRPAPAAQSLPSIV